MKTVYAGGFRIPGNGGGVEIRDPLRENAVGKTGNFDTVGSAFSTLMPYIFAVSGIILLFMIVSAGYSLMTSAGNPEAIEKGKARLTAGLTGFIIIFAAFWIWQLVAVFVGFGKTFPAP